MNRLSIGQIISFAIILMVQVLLLKNVQVHLFDRFTISIIIYPIIILMLPVGTRRSLVILTSFVLGLFIDMFYDSPGLHTATFVFTGFIRAYMLRILEPRLGFRTSDTIEPSHYGFQWFMSYIGILLFIHILVYFSLDAFSHIFFFKILINTLGSFVVSYLIIILYKMLL